MDAREVVEAARERAMGLSDNTAALAAVGGIVGGGLGLLLALSAHALRVRRDAGQGSLAEVAEAAEERASGVAEALSGARERAGAAAEAVAEAARGAAGAVEHAGDTAAGIARSASTAAHAAGTMIREGASTLGESVWPELKGFASEPALVALGALAVGAAAAALVPLTSFEEEVARPAKQRAVELVRHLVRDVGERIDARMAEVGEALGRGRGDGGSGTPEPEPSVH